MSAGHIQKRNKEMPWTTVYLGRVMECRARVERRHERCQSRENLGAALWHPVIEAKRVSEYEMKVEKEVPIHLPVSCSLLREIRDEQENLA